MMLSSNERDFLVASLKNRRGNDDSGVQRADGRGLLEFRRMNLSLRRSLNEPQSECELQLGRTRVLAVVSGEVVAPFPDRPTEGFLQFSVELSPMGAAIFEHKQAHKAWAAELSRIVERSIRDCKALDTEALAIVAGESVWAIKCTIHVLDHGGNLVDAVSIASIAALMHFRRPEALNDPDSAMIPLSLHHIPVSISFSFVQLDANDQDDPVVLLDPTDREEKIVDGAITYTFNSFRELCAVHKIGGVSISTDVVLRCANIAAAKAEALTETLKEATETADRDAIEQRRARLRGKEFQDKSVEALSTQKAVPLDVSGLDKAMEEVVDFATLHAPIPLRNDDLAAKKAATRELMASLESSAEGLAITQAAREHFHQLTQTVQVSKPAPAAPMADAAMNSDSDEEEEVVMHVQSEFDKTAAAAPKPTSDDGSSSDEEDLMAAIKRK
ncbi:exosome complex exonuclease RRP45-like protein [Achlya hypogyna]|uniref:Exosome complex exonuclease RRP45-like protein n=1 Tax=Achlya hypogyna TaxID=1202772 RepID=A0A1V9ZG54_ACHHY|nr:exosome complex exonuclease RRP45-like protein [Achlya hypogyna]